MSLPQFLLDRQRLKCEERAGLSPAPLHRRGCQARSTASPGSPPHVGTWAKWPPAAAKSSASSAGSFSSGWNPCPQSPLGKALWRRKDGLPPLGSFAVLLPGTTLFSPIRAVMSLPPALWGQGAGKVKSSPPQPLSSKSTKHLPNFSYPYFMLK